ncbi:ribosomal protein S18-alanine N-acetyltransferase [Gluconobacter frateurii]|uniref:[Ribosomal protein bS18]-alanine N-acetyltransferase n=1 Tax=Gluconobacter frateurii NRIC 0228 TaxID=1307946 RepID=A0ABQ0QB71_9PROT|nr:ribosomal protein S18-alanine N-acetyltransferase [Gluconobacter frateurii]GBR11717.1 ribosomal protein alanine acetyltransferase [Gluconobacter frateurii NRIC 0228]GLP89195.1 ribosomal-protein-alanine acetyltransferase [Gluconobacter frateurii]
MTNSKPGQTFQRLGVEGAPLLAALHAEAFQGGEIWDEASFASLLTVPGAEALVVSVDEQPAGFILTRTILDETEILTLAVRPRFQRLGLGRRLVEAVLPKGKIFLEVSVSNNAARSLYYACGFVQAGLRRGYYQDGSDAIVMISRI